MHMSVSSHLSLSLRAAQCGDAFLILKKFAYSRDFSGSPMVKTRASNAGDTGSILGQGTKIPQAVWLSTLHPPKKSTYSYKRAPSS